MQKRLAAKSRRISTKTLPLALTLLMVAGVVLSSGCSRRASASADAEPEARVERRSYDRGNPERVLGVNYNSDKLQTDRPPHKRVLFYAVNRIFDFVDMFTINVGVGPAMHAEFHFTNAARFGAGGVYLASFGTGEAPREMGFFGRGLAELSLGFVQGGVANYEQYLSSGEDYYTAYGSLVEEPFGLDIRAPSDQLYRKKRDYWGIGGSLGFLLVGGQFEMHPVQFFDFMVGWFGFDPLQDDK